MFSVFVLVYTCGFDRVTLMVAAGSLTDALSIGREWSTDEKPDHVLVTGCTSSNRGIVYDSSNVFDSGPLPGTMIAAKIK